MRVLLADTDCERAGTVEAALFQAGALGVVRPQPGEPVYDAVRRVQPDVILVDMQTPDRDALEDLRHVTAQEPRPIVMFIDANDPAFMEEAIQAGVSSYNVVGAELPDIKPIIGAAIAIFGRFRQLQEDLRRAEATLEERAAIDRAKAVLIRTRGMAEPEAYRWLRRQAMDRGRRIAEVAVELLEQAGGR
jgi:two-component system, response regulator / RNA-binding antiterminator